MLDFVIKNLGQDNVTEIIAYISKREDISKATEQSIVNIILNNKDNPTIHSSLSNNTIDMPNALAARSKGSCGFECDVKYLVPTILLAGLLGYMFCKSWRIRKQHRLRELLLR